jgi:hypothetical protein
MKRISESKDMVACMNIGFNKGFTKVGCKKMES